MAMRVNDVVGLDGLRLSCEPPGEKRRMPLYDFKCRSCRHEFEALVRPVDTDAPACPSCHGRDLEKLLSTFAVSSAEKTHAAVAKKRKKDASVARRDNVAKDIEAERHRLEDH